MNTQTIIYTINGTDIPNPELINEVNEIYNYRRLIESWKHYLKNCKRVAKNKDVVIAEIKTIGDINQLYRTRCKKIKMDERNEKIRQREEERRLDEEEFCMLKSQAVIAVEESLKVRDNILYTLYDIKTQIEENETILNDEILKIKKANGVDTLYEKKIIIEQKYKSFDIYGFCNHPCKYETRECVKYCFNIYEYTCLICGRKYKA